MRRQAGRAATYAILALVAVAGLALRLWNNDHGLPFVFNVDERSHFASEAVEMVAGGTLDPGYLQNPTGFTYLVYAALRLAFDDGSLARSFAADPTAVMVLARSLAAVVAIAGVIAVFVLGRRLWDARVGLVGAAVLAFAFLAVALSRLALTDVGTLAPVAIAVLGSVLALERGRARDFALAGAGAGLATGFKYTAGLVVLPLLLAGVLRLAQTRDRRTFGVLVLGLAAAVLAFFLTTPFALLHPASALDQLAAQAGAAGSPKLGQGGESPIAYYLESLAWGFGWLLSAAALAGAVVVARRDGARAAVLLPFPIALFAYLALQDRFFGRWLLPAYPVLSVLAAVALTELARRGARMLEPGRPRWVEPAILVAACAVVLAQPLAADWRSARLLGRADTRTLARDWLIDRYPSGVRISVEPEVPPRFDRAAGGGPPPFELLEAKGGPSAPPYSDTLSPATVDRLRAGGHCLVVTLGYVRGRVERDRQRPALDYYRRLERESRLVYRASPQRPGSAPRPFHFDLSYNGYPPELVRPGPEVRVLRLDRCRQGYGPSPGATRSVSGARPPGTRSCAREVDRRSSRRRRPTALKLRPRLRPPPACQTSR